MNWRIGLLNSDYVLNNTQVQNLIKDKDKKFDLVLAEQFNQESMYMFAHKFNCPLITIGEFDLI